MSSQKVSRMCLAALFVVLFVFAQSALATEAGQLDRSFGRDGLATVDLPGKDAATHSAVQPDGKIVLVGPAGNGAGIVRLLPNGKPDLGFGERGTRVISLGGRVHPRGVGLGPDGSIVVAALLEARRSYTGEPTADSAAQFVLDGGILALVKVRPDGRLDSTFGDNGVLLSQSDEVHPRGDIPVDIAVLRDGRILLLTVTGMALGYFGHPRPVALMQFTPQGRLDPTFGVGGIASVPYAGVVPLPAEMAIQPDGRIVVASTLQELSAAGSFTSWLSPSLAERQMVPGDIAVSRFMPNGIPDASFGVAGLALVRVTESDMVRGLAIQPDGKIVVHGNGSGFSIGGWRGIMARFTQNGTLDFTFGNEGRALYEFDEGFSDIRDIAVQPDGRLLAAAVSAPAGAEISRNLIVRFSANGALDPSFGTQGLQEVPLAPSSLMGVKLMSRSRVLGFGAGAEGPEMFAAVALIR